MYMMWLMYQMTILILIYHNSLEKEGTKCPKGEGEWNSQVVNEDRMVYLMRYFEHVDFIDMNIFISGCSTFLYGGENFEQYFIIIF